MPFSNINASIMLGLWRVMIDRLPEYIDGPHVFADVRMLTSENVPYSMLSISSVVWHSLEVQKRQGELSVDDHVLVKDALTRLEALKQKYEGAYANKLKSELAGLVAAWIADVEAERETGMAIRALPADLERRRAQIDRVLESLQSEMEVAEMRRRLKLGPPPPKRERRGGRQPQPVEEE